MKVRDLIARWEEASAEPLTARRYCIRLPVQDAARVEALAELYPSRTLDDILRDLVGAALDEVEEAFPYRQGPKVISEDDRGDPIYEDAGPAVRFRELAAGFARDLEAQASSDE
ncbi:MAG: type 1 pili tip component [Gammaproteobacteria bacterium]|nr:type 1 pili tip component [Gammaproteobacteria bacterium]